MVALAGAAVPTTAAFTDTASAQFQVRGAHWATSVCVIQSNEARPDAVFTIGASAPLGQVGWTTILNKTAATTPAQLAGCDVVMIAGEAWGVKPASRDLALAWMASGGSVLSTGNDTGVSNYPLPELIGATGEAFPLYPYGGSVPTSAAARQAISPAYPSWTPGAAGTYELDTGARPITAVAAGAVCVGTVAGHAEFCAAVARTNSAGGRWVHLHTKIGSLQMRGDVPAADAALAWLAIGRD
ncbi:hypothetical protein Cde04nite_35480 [Cellulomonas denverensis]|nr:hypothetical protein Cde04nite_35480 [Cellulomonas denverensis]